MLHIVYTDKYVIKEHISVPHHIHNYNHTEVHGITSQYYETQSTSRLSNQTLLDKIKFEMYDNTSKLLSQLHFTPIKSTIAGFIPNHNSLE